MTTIQILLLAVLFVAVFGLALLALRLLTPNKVQDRLETFAGSKSQVDKGSRGSWMVKLAAFASPLGKLSVPTEGWETSAVRRRFIHAGLRNPSAPALFFTAKTAMTVGLPLITFLALQRAADKPDLSGLFMWVVGTACLGYYLPNLVLNRMVSTRQRDIFESFPDALDLMTVCVEAGLAMDAALARVAQEIGLKSEVLAEEMQLVTLELRAGSSKEKALRNLALRTGVEDVDSLVTMLIQSERFGTSIGASLRVQSEQLRTKRRQRAEEQAGKIALKLLFPLIFFIFPALLVVLMGPAFLQIYRLMMPAVDGIG